MLLLLCEQEVSWDLCLKTDQKGVLYESNIRLLRVGRYVGVQTGSTGHAARGRRRRVAGGGHGTRHRACSSPLSVWDPRGGSDQCGPGDPSKPYTSEAASGRGA